MPHNVYLMILGQIKCTNCNYYGNATGSVVHNPSSVVHPNGMSRSSGTCPHSSEEDEVRKSENDGENGR